MPKGYRPSTSDDAVHARTGKTWDQWFALLDKWGAKAKGHQATATHLYTDLKVSPWWSQMVTVEYERSRGLRKVGQRTTGDYEVTMQRTVAAPVREAKAAWTEARRRGRWLTDPDLKALVQAGLRTARGSRTAMGEVLRLDLPGRSTAAHRLELTFTSKASKAAVRVQHLGIASKEERETLKRQWGAAMDAMKAFTDAGP